MSEQYTNFYKVLDERLDRKATPADMQAIQKIVLSLRKPQNKVTIVVIA